MLSNFKLVKGASAPSIENLDSQVAALIVVDMQQYQVKEGSISKTYGLISEDISKYYLDQVESSVEPNIIRLLNTFRSKNSLAVFTRYASSQEDESDLQPYIQEANRLSRLNIGLPIIPQLSSTSSQVIDSLRPIGDRDVTVSKSRSGAFTLTSLDELLRENGIQVIVIAGVLTHACVENTARMAKDLGYEVVVVSDATATLDPQIQANALAAMEILNIAVLDTGCVISAVENSVL